MVDVPWKPSNLSPRNHINQWGVSANIAWQISDTLSLTSITAYREYDTWSTWDEDASPFAIVQLDNKLENWQLSQELRLNGSFGEDVDWTVGAYYLDQESTYLARVDLNYAQIDFIHGPDPTPADTLAFFGHGSWDLTEQLRLSGGIRYSDEYKGYTHVRHNPDGSDIGSKGPSFPGAPDLINIRLTGVNGLEADFEDSQTDWRVALDYLLNDQMMVYTSASTGYKSGGVNPRPFFPVQLSTFNPETLTAYELGFKSTLFDSLRLNAAVFYNTFEDIQLTLTQCEVPTFVSASGFGPPCLKPANVGDADVKGLELEAHWYATENLLIDAMYSKLDFEYTYVDTFALQGSSIAPIDMITPYTPEDKWNIGAQYTFDFTEHGSLTARVDAFYQSETYADATNKPVNRIDDYTLMNAIVWWDSPEKDWRIDFTVQNLTDKVYFHDMYDLSGITSAGSVIAQPGLPRTYQLAFQKNFD
jgi:iron complex outermembrane receptor protein